MAKLLSGTRIYGTGTIDTQLLIQGTTASTSTTTGALVVTGGVGIGGNIAIGGALYAGGTTGTNGQILTSTGNGISWTTLSSSFNGGTITSPLIINNSTGASSTNTGALQVTNGGIGVGGNIFVGGVVTATTFIGNLTGTASTATAAATAYALANTGSTYVGFANLAANATTATNAATAYALANTGSTYVGYANLAANVNTIAQTANANYFLTFVDANNATVASELVYTTSSFTVNPASGGVRIGGVTTVTNTTITTSTITGALQVVGGVGIGGNVAIGGALYAGGTTGTNGQVLISTGNGISWTSLSSSFTGGTITNPLIINNSTGASSTNTGALQITNGGAGIGGGLFVGGTITATQITINGFAVSTGTSSGGSSFNVQEFTATAGQTTFTVSAGYTVGQIQVFANGINLAASDFTATNGSTVVLGQARNAGDIIRVMSLLTAVSGTANNVAGGTAGQLVYQSSPGVTAFTGGSGTTGNLLISNGTSAPAFQNTLTLAGTTAASSTSTGALQVRGGVGIGGNLYAGLDGYFNGVRIGRGNSALVTNLAVGNGALDTNTTGTNNIAVGYLSLNSNQTGANNVAVGYETMVGTTNAFADTALGARALQNISSGQYNIGIGYNAGNSITTGNGNTIIGSVSGTAGLTDTVIIAAGTTERIRVDGSNLYINGTIFTGGGGGGLTQGQAVAISMGMAMP